MMKLDLLRGRHGCLLSFRTFACILFAQGFVESKTRARLMPARIVQPEGNLTGESLHEAAYPCSTARGRQQHPGMAPASSSSWDFRSCSLWLRVFRFYSGIPAASATERRGQCAAVVLGALPAPLPGSAAAPDDYRMLA